MKSLLLYIIQSIVCSGLFLVFYQLCIMHSTSFNVSRRFLLTAITLSCTIPLLHIPIWPAETTLIEIPMVTVPVNTALPTNGKPAMLLWSHVGIFLYGLGTTLLLGMLLIRAKQTFALYKTAQKYRFSEYTIAVHPQIKSPFSFLRTLYLPIIEDEEEKEQIIAHEKSHIIHHHSQERIWMEILKAFCWFNPFVWMAARRLSEIQELEADTHVLAQGFNLTRYRTTLLKQVLGVRGKLVCNLTEHPLKKRFLAMTSPRQIHNVRALSIIPMLGIALVLFSFTSRQPEMVLTDPIDKQLKGMTPPSATPKTDNSENICLVKGTITDAETGEAVSEGCILEKKSKQGTVTDKQGSYKLQAAMGSTLTYIFPGYKHQQIKVPDKCEAEINLKVLKNWNTEKGEKVTPLPLNRSHQKLSAAEALILVNREIYKGNINEISPDRITVVTVIKNNLEPYIRQYGKQAQNGIISIELKN